jgi:hypothetical protein
MMGGLENDLDRLIRSSAGGKDHVPGVSQHHHRVAQLSAFEDVGAASFMMLQQQQQQQGLASFADEFLLNPLLAVPSSPTTTPWHNLLISMNNDPFSGSAPFETSSNGSLFLQQLPKDLLYSDHHIADFQTSSSSSVWGGFQAGENHNSIPKIGNFDAAAAIHEQLLNTTTPKTISSSVVASSARRNHQLPGHHQALGGDKQQLADDHDFCKRRACSFSQLISQISQFPSSSSSLSPPVSLPAPSGTGGASTRPSTPNSSISSGSFSDGPEDDASKQIPAGLLVGPSASSSSSKRKTPDRAMNENEDIQSPELKRPQ